MPVFYVDSSALVKLVMREAESDALRAYLGDGDLVSTELILTEIPRAVHRALANDPTLPCDLLLERAGVVLDAVSLRPLDRDLLAVAGALAEAALRTLDAIHVATAVDLYPLAAFVSYDERQSAAARLAGLRVIAPGV